MPKEYKIAVFSDIHGVLPAFEAVLNDAKKRNVDSYVLAGDYTEGGPNPNECLEIVKDLQKNGIAIAGNKETFIVDYLNKKKDGIEPDLNTVLYQPTLWLAEKLTNDNLNFIKDLPICKSEVINKKRIMVSHGSPDIVNEFLLEDDIKERSLELSNRFKQDIFIFGHTHIDYSFTNDSVYFVNPGAIGSPRGTQFCYSYSIISISNEIVKVQNIKVPYNKQEINSYFKQYVQDVGFAGQMLLDQLVSGKQAIDIYLRLIKKVSAEYGFEGNIYPQEISNKAIDLYDKIMKDDKTLEQVLSKDNCRKI